MIRQPPPIPQGRQRSTPWSPVLLSALVYPGTGQCAQRRWTAATVFGVSFTLTLGWFVARLVQIMTAYYELAFRFDTATGAAPSARALMWPFALSLLVYVACLVDAAIGARRT